MVLINKWKYTIYNVLKEEIFSIEHPEPHSQIEPFYLHACKLSRKSYHSCVYLHEAERCTYIDRTYRAHAEKSHNRMA